jgi:hypothetical protein
MNLTIIKSQETELLKDFPYKSFSDLPIYEQRYLPRWQTSSKAFYRKENSNVLFKTQLKDLTFAGACLHTDGNVHVNDHLGMKIYLSAQISVQVNGTVLWKRTGDDHSLAGILFDPLTEDTQQLILEYGFSN